MFNFGQDFSLEKPKHYMSGQTIHSVVRRSLEAGGGGAVPLVRVTQAGCLARMKVDINTSTPHVHNLST